MRIWLSVFFIFSFFLSCQKLSITSEYLPDDSLNRSSTKSKSELINYSVTLEDLEAYLKFKKLAYGKSIREITPYPNEEEIALYVINYDCGWELISADKRSTIVLGESNKGVFETDTDNVTMLSWVEGLADEVLSLKKIEGIPQGIDDKDKQIICNNLKFWNCINGNINNHIGTKQLTKTEIDPDDFGYWELVSVEVDSTFYDAPPRLTSTQWGQNDPYNCYYDRRVNEFYTTILAGSVAVAGAQLAYFLHNSIGRPEEAYGKANMQVYEDENLCQYYLTDKTSLIWPYMADNSYYNGYQSASLFILEIERATRSILDEIADRRYYDINTNLQYLVNYFNDNGVSCSLRSFNEEYIASSLLNGFPVVTSANTTRQNERNRHCFLIDGYKRYDVTYTYTYEWHNEDGSPSDYDLDVVEDHIGLQVSQYCMNWGWEGANNNEYFVSSASNWLVSYINNTYNYQYKGNIISGFALID